MSDHIEFIKDGRSWFRRGDASGNVSFSLVELRIKLMELVDEIDAIVDAASAEGQLNYEIAQRMNRLASRAHAAGMVSDMWNNQNSRFYKEREAIEGLRHG